MVGNSICTNVQMRGGRSMKTSAKIETLVKSTIRWTCHDNSAKEAPAGRNRSSIDTMCLLLNVFFVACMLLCFLSTDAMADAGDLDLSFGTDGQVITTINGYGGTASSVAIQKSDGKIVAVGSSSIDGDFDFSIVRYNTNGSLDISFGKGGIVTVHFEDNDYAKAVAIQSDGKIVVAGYSKISGDYDFSIVRLYSNGNLDTTFGEYGDGKETVSFSGNDYANAVAIQSDGKIVAAGYAHNGTDHDFAFLRLTSDGSPDTDFGTSGDGTVTVDFEYDEYDFCGDDDYANAVAIQSDGKIIAAGYADDGTDKDFALVRLTSNGSPDTSFGASGDGTVTVDFGYNNYAKAVAIQSDGKIIVAGYADGDTDKDFAIVRLTSNGSPDTSFGGSGNGTRTVDFGSNDYANAVAIQSDGKIIAAGTAHFLGDNDFAITRLNSAGNLDTSFGQNADGTVTLNFDWYDDSANAVAIQSDGKIVVAGCASDGATDNFAMARFHWKLLTGSLRVTISPQAATTAGAQWRMDGGEWQNSGATISSIPVGPHDVTFKDVAGWTTPPAQTVTVDYNLTTAVTGEYVQLVGSLLVTIVPQEAITAGAQWKVDSGAWQNSGATVPNISVGWHTVSFKDVAGWTTPVTQAAGIENGLTTNASGTYVQHVGSLTVTIAPQEAITAGAQWKVDGREWQNSGATASGIPVGSHTVTFKDVTGWKTPTVQSVTISKDQTKTASGTYVQLLGSLRVTISPQAATTAGAQWQMDGGAWQNSGATLSSIPVGLHTVAFKDVAGWATPVAQVVTISSGSTTAVSATYAQHVGSLTVTIAPQEAITAGAQWNVNGGEWQNSGTTIPGIPVGSYTVAFKDATGWKTPGAQTVIISKDQAKTASGTYVQLLGSLRVTISPQAATIAGAQWKVDSGAWINSEGTVPNIPIGLHTVTFKDVAGWTTPAPQAVTVEDGLTATASGEYVQQVGSLMVTIAPQEAIAAGAQWQVDGGAWQNSGTTLSSIPVGSHTVSFKDVTGWTTPAPQAVIIDNGPTTTASCEYVRQVGFVTVTIAPQGAIEAGAQWQVDNGAWQNSGATVPGIPVGSHTVTFKDVTGWTTPSPQTVIVSNGQSTTVTVAYLQQAGTLIVLITPSGAVTAGAQWRLDSGEWQSGGVTMPNIPVGPHTVSFKEVPGWNTPPQQQVSISNGQTTSLMGAYTQQFGSLTVVITPQTAATAGAQWKLDDGEWRTSGFTLYNIPVGQHSVSFKDIAGWDTPGAQQVSILISQTSTITGAYTQQTGSLTVTISPQEAIADGAQWSLDAGEWRQGGTTVSPVSFGQHTVKFKDVTGWITPQSQTVTIENGKTANALGTYVKQQTGPATDFSASPTSGPAPLAVTFKDLSTGTVSSWSWGFGDGGTSSEQNPTYTFNAPGTFTVSLTVTGPGGSTTEIKTNFISVSEPVVKYSLEVKKEGIGSGRVRSVPSGIDCGGDCVEQYEAGTKVTLSASPDTGSLFQGWSGGDCSGKAACVININQHQAVTATFDKVVASKPDLIVSVLSTPAQGVIGKAVKVPNTVRNQGKKLAGAFKVGVYLSADNVIDPATDLLLGSRDRQNLRPFQISAAITEVVIPLTVKQGTYYIGAVVDMQNKVDESNETNNIKVAARPIRIIPVLPDIMVSVVSAPATVKRGSTLSITDAVKNIGKAPVTKEFTVTLYLSKDKRISPASDREVGSHGVASLLVNQTVTRLTTVTIPADIAPGSYFVGVLADSGDVVQELGDGNNTRVTPGTIQITN